MKLQLFLTNSLCRDAFVCAEADRDDRVRQAQSSEAVFCGQGDSGGGVHLGADRRAVACGRC